MYSAHEYVPKAKPSEEACNGKGHQLRWTHTCLALKHLVSIDCSVCYPSVPRVPLLLPVITRNHQLQESCCHLFQQS